MLVMARAKRVKRGNSHICSFTVGGGGYYAEIPAEMVGCIEGLVCKCGKTPHDTFKTIIHNQHAQIANLKRERSQRWSIDELTDAAWRYVHPSNLGADTYMAFVYFLEAERKEPTNA